MPPKLFMIAINLGYTSPANCMRAPIELALSSAFDVRLYISSFLLNYRQHFIY